MDWFSLHFLAQMAAIPGATAEYQFNPLLTMLAYVMACIVAYATLTLHERMSAASRAQGRHIWGFVTGLCMGGGLWAVDRVALLSLQAPVSLAFSDGITLGALLLDIAVALAFIHFLGRPGRRTLDQWPAIVAAGLGIPAAHLLAVMAIHSSAMVFYSPVLLALSFLGGLLAASLAVFLRLYFRRQKRSTYALLKYAISLMTGLAVLAMLFTALSAIHLLVPSGIEFGMPTPGQSVQTGLAIGLITILLIGAALGAAYADGKLQSKEQDLVRVNTLLSQLDRARDSLQQLANYDHLTNLFNRRSFTEQFGSRLGLPEHRNRSLGVFFLDIDHFKRINDSLGHEAGDEILKIVAKRIRTVLRTQQDRRGDDLIARFGGDEFCILSPLGTRDEAPLVSQRILQKIKEPITVGGRTVVMTASIGICMFPEDGNSVEELMKNAELALYQAKNSGRNNVYQFSSHLKLKASLELQIEEDLRLAITNDALELHYQPVHDLKTGQVVKIEALLRWQHGEHGALMPDRFVSIAESNGFVDQLDAWAFRRACRDLHELHLSGWPELRVAVNCSALNLGNDTLADKLEDTLRKAGVAPRFVELEVTENAVMANIGKAAAQLSRMRDMGMGISIDDFGTGYSSLSYLKSLPINTLKVDRSFIRDIPGDSSDMEITAAIIAMAHKLNLQVVAEGAETPEQMQFLRDNGCDMVQGYFISEPLTLTALRAFLTSSQLPATGPEAVTTA
jgi:diguanylate cyclase (GGDEF)-like protein